MTNIQLFRALLRWAETIRASHGTLNGRRAQRLLERGWDFRQLAPGESWKRRPCMTTARVKACFRRKDGFYVGERILRPARKNEYARTKPQHELGSRAQRRLDVARGRYSLIATHRWHEELRELRSMRKDDPT